MYLHCVHNKTFYIEIGQFFFLKILSITTFETKMSYYAEYDI